MVVKGSVNKVFLRQGIGWGHLGSWGNLPDDINILEEKSPSGLAARGFSRVFDIEQVFVVSEDGW